MPLNYFLIFAIAAIVCAALLIVMLRLGLGRALMDIPNERSLHIVAIPRVGGIAIFISVAIAASIYASTLLSQLATPLIILVAVSLLDDKRNLPALARLSAHLLAALIFTISYTQSFPNDMLFPAVIVALTLLWMMNLYNFMDGANGLAGGMTLIGFASYGFVSAAISPELAMFCYTVSGAALGFLFFNFPIAKVFLGDAGSVPLGFLAAAIGLMGAAKSYWPWWFGPLIFSPFIVDASVTLLGRALRGEKFWRAHREHYYQRLILAGWSHTRLALSAYGLMLACSFSAIITLNSQWKTPVLLGWVVTYGLLIASLERRLSKNKK